MRVGVVWHVHRLLLGALSFVALASAALADSGKPSLEYQVKASMLFNFLQFVEWPPEVLGAGADIVFCVIGPDEFKAALDPVEGGLVRGHRVKVERMQHWVPGHTCHLAFSRVRSRPTSIFRNCTRRAY